MSQVSLVRTCDLKPGMWVTGTDEHRRVVIGHFGSDEDGKFDIWFGDGTVVRKNHPLTLWRKS